ncbi:MAG: hypothetical protein GY835_07340 [bacterium]|nr:hypothetical protein [bacterium]
MKIKILLLTIPVLLALAYFMPQPTSLLPEELVGIWVTDDVRYEDRYLKLSVSTVIFGQGETDMDIGFISNVELQELEDERLYTIQYHRTGEEGSSISLIVAPDNSDSLRFRNQRHIVWTRSTAPEQG